MGNIIKKLFGCIITIVVTIGLVLYLGYILRPTDTDMTVSSIKTFHELPENSLDVIGYGSSHMWRGLDTLKLYEDYGIKAYNYGCNWQHINTTSLFIKDSLRTQSPKLLLIDTFYVNNVLMNTSMDGEIYYTRAISNFEGKRQYLKECFGEDLQGYLSYYVPFCAFHENWVNISKNSFKHIEVEESFFENRGFVSSDSVVPVQIGDPTTFEQRPLNGYAESILDEIVGICKEKNIEIIFFTVPWQGEYAHSNAMKEYASQNGYPYFDMFELCDEVGLNGDTDFSDAGHLNSSGAAKVADYLGKYIVENYNM